MLDALGDGKPRNRETTASRARGGLLVSGGFVVLLFVIEVFNMLTLHALNRTFGLRPRSADGLLAGVAVAVKARARELGRNIRIIGVQAENAAAYPPSLAADALVPLKKVSTMADGIAVGRPGQLPFSIIRELVDDVVTVSEDSLARALIFLLERAKMVVEPAGAVGVAALMDGKIENPGTTAVILSGGNIDPMLMLKVIQRGLSAAGRYMTVRMMLDDRPGSLATIARIIAENDANVTGLDHTRVGGSISMGDVSITVNLETKGHEHCEQVLGALRAEGFQPIVVH
jgi:threonine dehydratase